MPQIMFGNSWENFLHAPPLGMQALGRMNLSFIRLWIFWDTTNPEPGKFDFSKPDADIAAIRAAGMQVYANILWAPPHAAQGQKTYLPYNDGCTKFVDPDDGRKGITFANERPFCSKPAHIDAAAARDFGVALATRYGDVVSSFAAWNEPGGQFYWPAWTTDGPEAGITRLLGEVVVPFTEGVRSVKPDARFVGPEADSEGVLDQVLKQEADRGSHLFDSITFHPYSWGTFPEDSYKRIDELFLPVANARGNGRPVCFSEVGDDGTGRIVEWTENVLSRRPALINFHDYKQWFEPGTWDNGTYVPNAKYTAMQALIAAHRLGRRRPVAPPGPRMAIKAEAAPVPVEEAVRLLANERIALVGGPPPPG